MSTSKSNPTSITSASSRSMDDDNNNNPNNKKVRTNDGHNNNYYETDTLRNQYLSLHYPSSGRAEGVPSILPHGDNTPLHGLGFPQRVAKLLIRLLYTPTTTTTTTTTTSDGVGTSVDGTTVTTIENVKRRALDIGCAVGGSSFELAKVFDIVDAFDYSANFIETANRMKDIDEDVTFDVPMEGDIHRTIVAVHDEGVTPDVTARVNFFVGDACRMDDMMKHNTVGTTQTHEDECQDEKDSTASSSLLTSHGYDGIIMSNLLCRLPDPMACLNVLPRLVKTGSVVVILTPFTWLEEFTPRERWLGGYYEEAVTSSSTRSGNSVDETPAPKPIFSKDRLKLEMERLGFVLIHEEQMPLIIREHQRKYQYCISEATGWRKSSSD